MSSFRSEKYLFCQDYAVSDFLTRITTKLIRLIDVKVGEVAVSHVTCSLINNVIHEQNCENNNSLDQAKSGHDQRFEVQYKVRHCSSVVLHLRMTQLVSWLEADLSAQDFRNKIMKILDEGFSRVCLISCCPSTMTCFLSPLTIINYCGLLCFIDG